MQRWQYDILIFFLLLFYFESVGNFFTHAYNNALKAETFYLKIFNRKKFLNKNELINEFYICIIFIVKLLHIIV